MRHSHPDIAGSALNPSDPRRRRLLQCGACGFALLLGLPGVARATLAGDGVGSLPALGDAAQGLLSPAVEHRLGERIMAEIRKSPEFLDDIELRDYLQGIVDELTPAAAATAEPQAPHKFEINPLRDATFNAFALPGGFVCMHTGLITDARAEDQLAAVLAHELSHITQRHIAQNIARAGTDTMLTVGSLVLAILAGATGNPDAAQGLALGGQAAAMDRALAFSRNIERDADRVGTAVLRASGLPPQAMASMLERLDALSRLDNADVYAFLRDHPLDSERIADAQARAGDAPLPPDRTLRFWLMNARARVLTVKHADDLRATAMGLAQPAPDRPSEFAAQRAAWAYGESLAWFRAGRNAQAAAALERSERLAAEFTSADRLPLDLMRGNLLLADDKAGEALALGRRLQNLTPSSGAARHLQVRALMAMPDKHAARDLLRQQTVTYPRDIDLWKWLAQASAATGALAAQHRATAEAYALQGNVEGAVMQLKIAQRTPDRDFIEASIIDARLAVMQDRLRRDKALDKLIPS